MYIYIFVPTLSQFACVLSGDWNVTDGKNGDSVPFADGLVIPTAGERPLRRARVPGETPVTSPVVKVHISIWIDRWIDR